MPIISALHKLLGASGRHVLPGRASFGRNCAVPNRPFGIGKIPEEMTNAPPDRIRNVGIMAHIDAGKTTSTERMLYIAGVTTFSGDVDKGDTVMDYMAQERERGITITSAAISFPWKGHRLNFIDTPGHVDFTVEVERSLRVLDGAVAVYDSVKGIQAQSVTVWRQAQRYDVPCVALINKMDRTNASATRALEHMETKLGVTPIPVQIPDGVGTKFTGVVDLLRLNLIRWPGKIEAKDFTSEDLTQLPAKKKLLEKALEARQEMFEQLAEVDETFMDHYLGVGGEAAKVDIDTAKAALRQVTINRTALPVFYGSALRNRGMEPVLDAIVDYLPAPNELRKNAIPDYAKDFCAFVFKVTHDKRRGPLVFMRVYSGEMKSSMEFYNVNRDCVERASRVILISADEYNEVSSIGAGNIAAVLGLKQAVTGDTLISLSAAGKKAGVAKGSKRKERKEVKEETEGDGEPAPTLPGLRVPEPVFFCTVEVDTAADQPALDQAFACLCREDPSLRVTVGDDNETILSGMGELHIEIIKDRLMREYKVNATLGPLQVAFRETFASPCRHLFNQKVAFQQRNYPVLIEVVLSRMPGDTFHDDPTNILQSVTSAKTSELQAMLTGDSGLERLEAIRDGLAEGALSLGPLLGFPLRNVHASITQLDCKPYIPREVLQEAAHLCFLEALGRAEIQLIEPIMQLQIAVPPEHFTTVLGELTRHRRGLMDGMVEDDIEGHVLTLRAPLEALKGYNATIRKQTSGHATYSMHLLHYAPVTKDIQQKVVKAMTFSFDADVE